MKKIAVMCILLLSCGAYAYDNVDVHPQVNESAVLSASKFATAMKSIELSGTMPKELIELNVINGKKIKDWFRKGGEFEDDPGYRTSNHFHDPLRS